jgi:hypothetical protein
MSQFAPAARREAENLARKDPFWPAQLTVLAAIVLSLDLPSKLTISEVWLIPTIEAVGLAGLILTTPWTPGLQRRQRRRVALSLVGLVTVSNLVNLGLLVHAVLHPHAHDPISGRELIVAGTEIWVTNVLLFTVWYWELDRGGPLSRKTRPLPPPDFLFPQMTDERLGGIDWLPCYLDYLYTSFTNATAFSPTDTMPLTPMAKLLMGAQSLASLITIGMVFARAVNILT